jgi:hypothetical protein
MTRYILASTVEPYINELACDANFHSKAKQEEQKIISGRGGE